jgi:hypothetical protein
MANLKAKIQTTGKLKGKSRSQREIVAQNVTVGQFDLALSDLADVNTAGQTDGGMMQFDGSSGKYEIRTELQNSNLKISSGTY